MASEGRLLATLTVPGTLASLGDVAAFVQEASGQAGLATGPAYRLRLAVDEIATNIITHGYEEAGREGALHLQSYLDDAALTIHLDDEAEPFDPRQHDFATTDLEKPLAERRVGGLGIFLALDGVDEFDYRRAEERNRCVFVVNRPRADAGDPVPPGPGSGA